MPSSYLVEIEPRDVEVFYKIPTRYTNGEAAEAFCFFREGRAYCASRARMDGRETLLARPAGAALLKQVIAMPD